MNPITLFNFPYVVQREIMDSMDLHTIFLLSIASKRMNNLIVSVEKARFTKIKYILMNISYTMRIEAVRKLPSPRPQDLVLIYNNYLTNNPDRVFSRTILESIQNHSYSLFGNDKEYQVNVCMYQEFQLPNLKNVSSSYIWKFPTIEGKTLDDFCSLSPNQEFLFVAPEVKGQLDDSSVIYGYKTIQIEEKDAMIVPSILREFRGNQAFLWTSKIENSDIVQFLKRWMLNDGFDNLEVLTIDSKLNSQLFDPNSQLFDPTEIRNSIGLRESNTAITPPIFYFKRRFRSNREELISAESATHFHIVREHDQRVASVMITQRKFFFGVWNLTEEDFIKKFSEMNDELEETKTQN
ncbi:hypothetical protein CRE_08206 [Caenorhabditis remanei]|uniref:F-box domain-containing protein n=1 Tax=Caenorhabditis remanei TaxID=31234 RepID=E3M320_CAERE|nr:hypothetical protein CRE_08206 [Caenorhabditis remanei]